MSSLFRQFQASRPVPPELRPVFLHLYWDIAWFGLLAGSSLSFVAVYAARLEATPFQIGLLSAGPAAVGLLFTLPAGRWLHNRPIGPAVFRAAALSRLIYLPWIALPLWPWQAGQIWTLIILTLLATIPGTILAVGFNALYAAAVPVEWRGHVAGRRNALMAVVFIGTSLLSGYILDTLPLVQGYQVLFAIGFVGATASTIHLWFLRTLVVAEEDPGPQVRSTLGDFARPGNFRLLGISVRSSVALRVFTRSGDLLRVSALRGPYGRLIAALFAFHFAQFMPGPLFPIQWVDNLGFSDGDIALGTALFYVAVLAGSLRFDLLTEKIGNRYLTVGGALLLSLYPLITAFMTNLPLYLVASVLGGLAWSLVGGALANYLLEKVPSNDRPAYLAWYNLALNAAILTGSLAGPLLERQFGLINTLVLAFFLRMLAAYAIWRADWTPKRRAVPVEDGVMSQAAR